MSPSACSPIRPHDSREGLLGQPVPGRRSPADFRSSQVANADGTPYSHPGTFRTVNNTVTPAVGNDS
jgi:hypothetical protein